MCHARRGWDHYIRRCARKRAIASIRRYFDDNLDIEIGDLKASLDKLQVPNKEQKELLSIIESTRPEIVTQR